MYSRSLSCRNHRPKGIIKVKHILQICLLAAVCFWLIYQGKPSHQKEKELDGKGSKSASEKQSSSEILRLGRKDVVRATETIIDATILHEGDDQENEADEEEKRHAEDEKGSVESRVDDREEEEDKVGDEVQDDLILDEDKETDEDSEKKDNEESETSLDDHDEDNLIVPGFLSSENSTVLRDLNDQSQRSNDLTESNSKQSNGNQFDVNAPRGFAQKVHITSEESVRSLNEVNLPFAENINGSTETNVDDNARTDLDVPLDYSGFFL